jgi:hypothetical protein
MDTFFDKWVKHISDQKSDRHGIGYYLPPADYPLDIRNQPVVFLA